MKIFILNSNTRIQCSEAEKSIARWEPVRRAIERFYRDINMVLTQAEEETGSIILKYSDMKAETYLIVVEENQIIVQAGDELGFVYAFSEKYFGIMPFWFWNDQKFEKKEQIVIPVGKIAHEKYRVRFRGYIRSFPRLLINILIYSVSFGRRELSVRVTKRLSGILDFADREILRSGVMIPFMILQKRGER